MSGWLGEWEGELGYCLWNLAWWRSFTPLATEDARVVLPEPGMPAIAMRRRAEAEAACNFSMSSVRLCRAANLISLVTKRFVDQPTYLSLHLGQCKC